MQANHVKSCTLLFDIIVVAGAPNDSFGQVAAKWNQAGCLCVLHSSKATKKRYAFFPAPTMAFPSGWQNHHSGQNGRTCSDSTGSTSPLPLRPCFAACFQSTFFWTRKEKLKPKFEPGNKTSTRLIPLFQDFGSRTTVGWGRQT